MSLFGKKAHETIVVVDIRSSSAAAAYVIIAPGVAPEIVHSVRFPIDPHATEPLREAMPRTLEVVLHALLSEGTQKVHAAIGTAAVDRILVTVTAPWQSSQVHSVTFEEQSPFLFTKHVLDTTLAKEKQSVEGRVQVSELVLATLLNGYEVENPFNKRVKRAEVVMLSASLEEELVTTIRQKLRKTFHVNHIDWNAFMPELYTVTRTLYPHQKDYLVLDVGNEATDILLVKHGFLASTVTLSHGVGDMARAARGIGVSSPAVPLTGSVSLINPERNGELSSAVEEAERIWLTAVHESLAEIAKQEPLPRAIFLLAEESVRDFLRRLLDAPELRALWLSEESLGIIPILPTQLAPYVSVSQGEVPDPAIALLALSASKRYLR